MIVKSLQSPVYYKRKRTSLPGRGKTAKSEAVNQEKSFEQFLLEAFRGEVVQEGANISPKVGPLTRDNLVRIRKA